MEMNREMDQLIEAVQSSGFRAALAVSGGGSGAIHALLSHPGASRLVLEVQVPYSAKTLFDYLGEEVEQACSAQTAALMAGRAFERAVVFTLNEPPGVSVLGIACTAALQTNRQRRGEERAYLHIKSRKKEVARKVEFKATDRSAQEEALSQELLYMIGDFVGVTGA